MRILAAAALAALTATSALAQDYPSRTITIIVPFAAGGPTDTVARLVAQAMARPLKQQVVVENVGGPGGTIGAARVAKATPDGYTLLLHHIGMATTMSLYRKKPFDAVADFEPIGLINEVPMTIVGKPGLAANTLPELVAFIRANKDKVNYANAGIGAASHLCGLLFMHAIQAQMTTVPYPGTGPAMNDLLGGQVDVMCDQTTSTTGHIKAGRIKAYGVTTPARVESLADLPTLDEAGIKGFNVSVWHGLYAPKGTPKAAIDKLVPALQEALQDATVKERFAGLGTSPVALNRATPAALGEHVKAEIAKWDPIIKAAGSFAD